MGRLASALYFYYFNFNFFFFGAAPTAYGSSQARDRIGAIAAGLHHSHSHSHARSKPCLQPIPQLTATQDPQPTELGQGSNPTSSWIPVGFISTEPKRELP